MNTIELDFYLKRNAWTKKSFLGVYPCDKLPRNIKRDKTYFLVANFSPSSHVGTHWITFLITPVQLELFDSSGATLIVNRDFQKFVRRNKRKRMVYNSARMQDVKTSCCGEYCCIFSLFRCLGGSFEEFLKLFHPTEYVLNDEKIQLWFKALFKH